MARLRLEAHFHTAKGIVKHAFVQDGVDDPASGLTAAAQALAEWWEMTGCGQNLPDSSFTTGPEFEAAEDCNRR